MSLTSNISTSEVSDETFEMSTGSLATTTDEEFTSTGSESDSETTDSTEIDSLIAGKLKKYLKKYDLDFFKRGWTNKFIDLDNLPEVDPDNNSQLFYYDRYFVTKEQLENLTTMKAEQLKVEIDTTKYEILDSCDVMKKLANQKECSTCHEDCKSCHDSHAKKWYDKLNVSSANSTPENSGSESLTFKSCFRDKYYTSLYCYPYDLLKYGTNLFKTYKVLDSEIQNSRLKKYKKILNDDGFEFADDSNSFYKEKSDKTQKKIKNK